MAPKATESEVTVGTVTFLLWWTWGGPKWRGENSFIYWALSLPWLVDIRTLFFMAKHCAFVGAVLRV
jgi:hypothetical protein